MKKATRRWLLQSVRKLITCWQRQKLEQRLQKPQQKQLQLVQKRQQQERLQQQELLFLPQATRAAAANKDANRIDLFM
jgi:hypothetical protein